MGDIATGEAAVNDNRSAVGKYATVLVFWLVPVALILIPILYPAEGYVREMLVLPVLLVLLYVAVLLAPLFRPLRNIDFFDDIPEAVERHVDALRTRREARELIRLYSDGGMPDVYSLSSLTPFQRGLKWTLDTLRLDSEWHSSNLEVSRDLLERMESLIHTEDEPAEIEDKTRQARKKVRKRR